MSEAPALTPVPPDVVSLADHERIAQAKLDANARAYFDGGAADELTLAENTRAWARLRLRPRVLRDLTHGHTRLTLLGRELPHPILLAPVAFQRMAHPDGEFASALAASSQGAGMVLSSQASMPLELIAQAIGNDPHRGPLWFQLYLQHDRDFTLDLVRRAEAAGYEALVLTADAPVSGARDRERRAGFSLPAGIEAVNLRGLPPWLPSPLQAGQSALFNALLRSAPTWSDVAWLKQHTRLPIIIKGVLHPDDARIARDQGAAAIIVSNHGGRTLDTAVDTATALQEVCQAVGSELPVLVDGGIRRGTDVLKAMVLGARAVLIGRPQIHGLATAGAQGVAHVLRLLRDELEIAMALSGCATLEQIDPDLIQRRPM